MSIPVTEFRNHIGKYLKLSATEDIFITRNGKVVSKLTGANPDRVDLATSLFGVLPDDISLEQAREERLGRI